MKKIKKHLGFIFWVIVILIWQLLKPYLSIITPTPSEIIFAIFKHKIQILFHLKFTLQTAFLGILIGIFLGFFLSFLIHLYKILYKIIHPFFIVFQNIPSIVLAPILVLYLGYNDTPKLLLISLNTTFAILFNLYEGLNKIDKDYVFLLKTLNANRWQIFWHFEFFSILPYFFAGLKISLSYAFVGAIVCEWMSGFNGLGVLMINARKLFEYDLMFAVVLIVCILSLSSVWLVGFLDKKLIKWKK